MAKQKYYVVWKGVTPGVYTSWTDCQLQIKDYKGALYKSFETREEAEAALASPAHHYLHPSKEKAPKAAGEPRLPEGFDLNCLAVDAACSGNPGPMEYRGVYLQTDTGRTTSESSSPSYTDWPCCSKRTCRCPSIPTAGMP